MINYSVSLIKVKKKKKEHLYRLCDRFTNSKCLRVKVEHVNTLVVNSTVTLQIPSQ